MLVRDPFVWSEAHMKARSHATRAVGVVGRRTGLALLFAVLLIAMVVPGPAAAQTDPVSVTLSVSRFLEIRSPDPGDPFGDGEFGDYFALVCYPGSACSERQPTYFFSGDRQATDNDIAVNDPDVSPNWRLTHTFDRATDNIGRLKFSIWDFDGLGNDIMDINPNDDKVSLDIAVDLNTGEWRELGGAIPPNRGFAQGDGDTEHDFLGPGGEEGKVLFDISLSADGDVDGDSIPDGHERSGVLDTNGNVLLDLPSMGADPRHKDVFVEADFMDCAAGGCPAGDTHSDQPQAAALADVRQAFAASPVPNPDGIDGIDLHTVIDEAVPHQDPIAALGNEFYLLKSGLAALCAGRFGTAADRAADNCIQRLHARRATFHYALFAHGLLLPNGNRPTGQGELPGNDFVVGVNGLGANTITGLGGQAAVEADTFMHELGHNLGLAHGGGDGTNCKPNYLSVMNYSLSYRYPNLGARPLDYSQEDLPDLDEDGLNEPLGLGGSTLWPFTINALNGTASAISTAGAIDWDDDGTSTETDVDADVNFDVNFGAACPASPDQILTGHEDWHSLDYDFRDDPAFADGVVGPEVIEPTVEEIESHIDRVAPELRLPQNIVLNATGPAGATVTYAATAVDNMDPHPTVECQPRSGDTYSVGLTSVTCIATDQSGNSSTGTFTVKVKGAAEQLADLIAGVRGLAAGDGLKNSLIAKLRNALARLRAGGTRPACNDLAAFQHEVRAQAGKQLAASQATGLVADATRIRTVISCN